jgi:hypothetical protein
MLAETGRRMPQPKPLPPLETLQATFAYSPETGALTWLVDRSNGVRAGMPAGNPNPGAWNGYSVIKLGHRRLQAHRVAWALYNGTDPGPLLVDHINRNRSDNRAANLRLVDAAGNRANSSGPPPPPPLRRPVQVFYPSGESRLLPSVGAAARFLGCSARSVYRYARGLRQHPAGLTVAYA